MPISVFRRGVETRWAAAMVGLLVLGVAACGGKGTASPPLPPSPGPNAPVATPTSQLTPEEQQAVDEVQRLFDEFMRAYADLATSGDPPSDDAILPIGIRSVPPLFSVVNTELVDNYLAQRRMSGELGWEFRGVAEVRVDPDTDPDHTPQVQLHYCVDAVNWTTVDRTDNEPADGDTFLFPSAHMGVVRAIFFDRGGPEDPRWYLTEWMEDEAAGAC